jgi:hypothetical protein
MILGRVQFIFGGGEVSYGRASCLVFVVWGGRACCRALSPSILRRGASVVQRSTFDVFICLCVPTFTSGWLFCFVLYIWGLYITYRLVSMYLFMLGKCGWGA